MGGDAAKARKVAQMRNDVAALEAALQAAQQEYERVKARNLQVGAAGVGGWSGTMPPKVVCPTDWYKGSAGSAGSAG